MVGVGTHSSGLKLDLNVGGVNTFVEDRERELVFGFIKFESESRISEYFWIKCSLVRTNLGVGIVYAGDLGDREEKDDTA